MAERRKPITREELRLGKSQDRTAHWRRWGPYLSERQWRTVREDYSADGAAWEYFPHDHARSRAYRWGEDGLAGISDNHQRHPILKERLFGLTNRESNHGEDVKECYFYLDATMTRHATQAAASRKPGRSPRSSAPGWRRRAPMCDLMDRVGADTQPGISLANPGRTRARL